MVYSKLFYYAGFFEFSAIGVLFLDGSGHVPLARYLLLHGAGSALLALALSFVVPTRYRKPRHWLLAYLFAFNFFIPLAGLICAAFALLLGFWTPRPKDEDLFAVVAQPRFITHRSHEGTGFRGGQIRAQLGNARTPLAQRMTALVAVQDAPTRVTGDLLRTLLADPTDDIRLLAYGILDLQEKGITRQILSLKAELAQAESSLQRHSLHKRLAELYWELAFQNVVQGDMLVFSIDQVRLHAEQALKLSDDAGLWFLLARLELRNRQVDSAAYALQRAEELGFVRERLLPYLAELRFQQRQYAEVRQLFTELGNQPGIPALGQCRAYWSGRPLAKPDQLGRQPEQLGAAA